MNTDYSSMMTDSYDYDVLIECVKLTKNIPGLICEIGMYQGGSTKIILDTLREIDNKNRIHIGIDPYGNIAYAHWENKVEKGLNYTNHTRNRTLWNLYSYCYEHGMTSIFFNLEDTEFFKRYSDGVPIYCERKFIINDYSLVFLDGPHTVEDVLREFEFFKTRISRGGMIIFDDVNQYPHMEKVDEYVKSMGFELVHTSYRKISYRKI